MLAPKKYPGLLVTPADKEQALYKGLLGLGAQLSQGYTDKPTSFMGNLGQAGLGFQKGYGDQIALTKADQLQNMQAQAAQASLAEQQRKIQAAADQKKAREAFFNIPRTGTYSPNMMGGMEQTDDMGNVTNTMSQAEKENLFGQAFPDEFAKQKAQALFPSTSVGSRPAASIQEYNQLQELIKRHPPIKQKDGTFKDSSEVSAFKNLAGNVKTVQLGDNVVTMDNAGRVIDTMPVGLSPEKKPAYLQTNAAMKEALPEIRADTQTANSALRAYKSKTKLLEDLKNTDNIDVYTGALADFKLSVGKIREQFMGDTPEAIALREKISSTEFLSSRMGADVFAMLKPLGIGARGLDTPAERKFLQEVLTGKIGLQRETLIKMTQLSVDTNKDVIDAFNKRIGESNLYKSYLYDALGYDKDRFKLGGQAKRVKVNKQGEVVVQ